MFVSYFIIKSGVWEFSVTYVSMLHLQGCTLHFDGASKGNPGVAGAGVVLRADDGSLV